MLDFVHHESIGNMIAFQAMKKMIAAIGTFVSQMNIAFFGNITFPVYFSIIIVVYFSITIYSTFGQESGKFQVR